MLSKQSIVNFLFVLSFPFYGIGAYLAAKSPTVGFIFSVLPHIGILVFYFIDLLYRREFEIKLNGYYFLMVAFLISSALSLFIALNKNLPETNQFQVIGKMFLIFIPFHSFIVFSLYNSKQKEVIPRLTLLSLSILLGINILGYFAFGMANMTHNLEGRINFPFLGGLYNGASLLAIINLMLLFYASSITANPIRFVSVVVYFMVNLVFLFLINSRIVILIFLLVLILFIFKAPKKVKGLYWLSLFTLPILMSSSLLLYQILSHPWLASVMQRVNKVDVTTFNGRAFLWQDAIDWMFTDQRGLFWGNGYKGHYFIDLVADVAKLWNERHPYRMHLHSTVLEIMVSQGVIALIIFMVLAFLTAVYYRREYKKGKPQGVFFAMIIFLLFVMQVDLFVYWESLGFMIFSLLLAQVVIRRETHSSKRGIEITPSLFSLSF